jgi:hypothetical protein
MNVLQWKDPHRWNSGMWCWCQSCCIVPHVNHLLLVCECWAFVLSNRWYTICVVWCITFSFCLGCSCTRCMMKSCPRVVRMELFHLSRYTMIFPENADLFLLGRSCKIGERGAVPIYICCTSASASQLDGWLNSTTALAMGCCLMLLIRVCQRYVCPM